MVCSQGPYTHDAIVGDSQKENVLLLEAKAGWNNDDDDHVEQEDDLGVTAKIDDAQGKRTRSEDQAGKVGGQNLDNLQLCLSLFNYCNCLMCGLFGYLLELLFSGLDLYDSCWWRLFP